ncbi:hypothetical protein NE852_11495 [Rhizobium sp. Pop5]|uniref:hypothetical protein n=1 Tax=Rhizobium sp. Pop5 TaxID=1223565 RepID=UPI00056444E0|nr:hypothetical protein [Rhizobium sp. Pop5]UVD59131.1 hypothetical protein NE852_11495 [Rhizobium sp. Pop5]
MRARTATIMISVALLAGCAPTQQDYDAIVTLLQGSARARNQFVNDCSKGFDANERRNAGIVINVSDKDAPRIACQRYLAAALSGRATYQDLLDIKAHRFTPKLIKIFQGR